jgi:glycosyltransferase involved in cell wall biosynthesis
MPIDFLYLVADLGNGGQERQLYYLNKTLKEKGYKTAVAVWDLDRTQTYYSLLTELGIEVINLSGNSVGKKINLLRAFINQQRPKVIHSFSFHLNVIAFASSMFSKCTAIGGIRNRFELYRQDSPFITFWLNCFTPKNQISNNYRFNDSFALKKLHSLTNKTYLVNNALDIQLFNAQYHTREGGVIKTVSVGRLYPEKRIDLLIQLLATLSENGYSVNHAHAGTGPLEPNMKKLVEEKGLNNCFEFVGNIKNINAFMSTADFMIHTADYEGYPNVLMEAMASGKPIVTTDCGDASFLVEDNVNGFIVPVGDVQGLAKGAIKLIENEDLCKRMGEQGREKAEETFSLDSFVNKVLNIYNQVQK